MTTVDLLGWIGNVGFLLGAIYIARNKKVGFYWQIEGNFFYLIQGHLLQIPSLQVLSLVLIVVNVYGIYYWNNKKEN